MTFHRYKPSEEDEGKIIRDTVRDLYPAQDGLITPTSAVPMSSRELLGMTLLDHKRFKLIGRVLIMEGEYPVGVPEIRDEVDESEDVAAEEQTFRIKDYAADLPKSLLDGDENVFAGPLMINDEFYPNGFGVWELLPKEPEA